MTCYRWKFEQRLCSAGPTQDIYLGASFYGKRQPLIWARSRNKQPVRIRHTSHPFMAVEGISDPIKKI